MKKLLIGIFAIGLTSLLAVPARAQKGGHGRPNSRGVTAVSHRKTTSSHVRRVRARSNQGGKVRGLERAEEVQSTNAGADANRGFTVAPGVEKAEQRAAMKRARHRRGSSHIRKGKKHRGDDDQNEDRDHDESDD